MTDKKFTDEEIVRALQQHSQDYDAELKHSPCDDCPVTRSKGCTCIDVMAKGALDIINRQKAEIAWLRDTITGYEKMEEELHENHKTISKSLDDIARMIPVHDQKVRAEAIKEFAERLKETMTTQTTDNINEPCVNIIYYADETIDEIAKELTEGRQ